MKRNWEMPQEFGVAEPKADQAEVCSSLEGIERYTGWDVPSQEAGVNLVVQHHEVSPFSSKESSFGLRHEENSKKEPQLLIYQAPNAGARLSVRVRM